MTGDLTRMERFALRFAELANDDPRGKWLQNRFLRGVSYVWVRALISNRMLNQMRFQFSRYTDIRRDLQPALYISRSGYSIEGGRLGPFGLGANPEDTWEAANTVSYVTGSHSARFGGGVKYVSAHTEALEFGHGAYFFGGPEYGADCGPGRFRTKAGDHALEPGAWSACSAKRSTGCVPGPIVRPR